MIHSGNIAVKVVVGIAIILLAVFAITKRAAAPVEEGIIPDQADRAVEEGGAPVVSDCGERNAVCETSDDCCGNLGLECQDVRTGDGGFGTRCLPVEVMICRSDCTGGIWGSPRDCRPGVAPSSMAKCETFTGEKCKESVHADRNDRECWNT